MLRKSLHVLCEPRSADPPAINAPLQKQYKQVMEHNAVLRQEVALLRDEQDEVRELRRAFGARRGPA